jgi:hypothetical protein
MALDTPVLLDAPSDALGSSVVSATINIPDGAACLVFIFNRNTGVSNVCSDSSGLTWTQLFASSDQRIRVFTSTGDSGSGSTVVTVTKTGPCICHIINIGNASLTPVQTKEIVSVGGANKTLTFDSSITTGNAFVGYLGHTVVRTTTSDNNELSNVTLASSATSASEFDTTGSTLSWTHSGATSAAFGLEIEEAGGPTFQAAWASNSNRIIQ